MGFHNFNREELRCMLYTYDELKEDGIDIDTCPFWLENFHECRCTFCSKQTKTAPHPSTQVRVPTVSKKGTTVATQSMLQERLYSYTCSLKTEIEHPQLNMARIADILEAIQKASTNEKDGSTRMTVELLKDTKLGYLLNKKVRKLDALRLPVFTDPDVSRVNTYVHTLLKQWKSLVKKRKEQNHA